MAYAAADSLRDVLDQRLNHSPYGFANERAFPESLKPLLQRLYQVVCSIQDFDFEELDSPNEKSLEKEIMDALWRTEDVIESYWLSIFPSSEDIVETPKEIMSTHSRLELQELLHGLESAEEKKHAVESYLLSKFPSSGFIVESSADIMSTDRFSHDGMKLLQEFESLKEKKDDICIFFMSSFPSSEDIVMSTHFSHELQELLQELESAEERIQKHAEDRRNRDYSISRTCSTPVFDSSSDPSVLQRTVGLDKDLEAIKYIILDGFTEFHCLGAVVIHGMGGIGKTSLAKLFYNDSDIRNHFCIGAWVSISLKHCVRDILLNLLHTEEMFNGERIRLENVSYDQMEDDILAIFVRDMFAHERYLVMVDCLCEINRSSWDYIKNLLPDSSNGSRIVLVNRCVFDDDELVFYSYKKKFLTTSQSWSLLKAKVFGEEPCPRELKKIGRKIAQNCLGLPLAIITAGIHLAKEEKTVEYWNKVAQSQNSIAYAADGAPMFQQLGLSYKQMPQRLRPAFLYMAVFLQMRMIPIGECQALWVAEGLLTHEVYGTKEHLTSSWIKYFERRNLVTVGANGCFLHPVLWHFCLNQAVKEKFFHFADKYSDVDWLNTLEGMDITNNLRRLVIPDTVLLGISEVFKSTPSVLPITIRSLLFTGPDHPYPLQILWSGYKMLRVLEATSIRFYEFPDEILCLTLLRYIAMTVNNGVELPPGISKLRNLQFLIVSLHQMVRSLGGAPSYLPMEIWEMQQLISLRFEGSDLPVPPPHSDAVLPNLSELFAVSPHSCKKEVLERIPNLKNLTIGMQFAPINDAGTSPFSPFDNLFLLQHLETLSCIVDNPFFQGYVAQPRVVAMPESVSISMDSLTRLSLRGCGFSWESIKQISRLPRLQSLRLQRHAFRGPEWKLTERGFLRLTTLCLEDLDLVSWTSSSEEIFPCLESLEIRRCHILQRIPPGFVTCSDLRRIEVVDSSSVLETWARSMQMARSGMWVEISSPRVASASTN